MYLAFQSTSGFRAEIKLTPVPSLLCAEVCVCLDRDCPQSESYQEKNSEINTTKVTMLHSHKPVPSIHSSPSFIHAKRPHTHSADN